MFNGFPDLHTYWRVYSSLNTLSMIFLILFAKHDNGFDYYDCEIQTNVNALRCVPIKGIHLYT